MRAARSKADRNGEKCSHVYVVRTWLIDCGLTRQCWRSILD